MRILVLGGTAFLGRAVSRAALARGHEVVCAARGSAPVADGARLVAVDRDDPDGLAPLRGQRWDAVVDVSRQPGQVRRAVAELTADHWVLVSSANVYARFDHLEQDEHGPLLDPLADDVMPDMSRYGEAKVACEQAVATTSSWTAVRAGLICGPGDDSGRLGYYPWRLAHPTGADVLVPPDLDHPVAVVDVDDLADWLVTCAQEQVHGALNATGPTHRLGDLLDLAREVAGSDVTLRPVPAEVLAEAGVEAWAGTPSLPLWVDDPEWRFFSTLDSSRARAAGLVTRPLRQSLARALAHEQTRTTPRTCGLTDEQERDLRRRLDHHQEDARA